MLIDRTSQPGRQSQLSHDYRTLAITHLQAQPVGVTESAVSRPRQAEQIRELRTIANPGSLAERVR